MEFHHRKQELALLNLTYQQSTTAARMVVITGRRRVGKTVLALKHVQDKPHLYLFVGRKAENLLCGEFIKQIQETFPETPIYGEVREFKEVFRILLNIAKKQRFVLILDEFQEFTNINPAVYSDMQNLWDLNKAESKMQLLLLGSVYSLMHKIFQDSKEPLFGRADRLFKLRPFLPHELYQILQEYGHPDISTLFAYYIYTSGMPKYVELLLAHDIFNEEAIINFILSEGSPLLDEGKNVLIEEFGKEYGFYFSILELIAAGKTARSEIESNLQKDIGGYLERLDTYYAVLAKYKPITAKPNAKTLKYYIKDNFLLFWFRFIFRNRTAIETGNFDYVKKLVLRDLNTYKGKLLERLYYELFAASHQYNMLGSYWERDGLNEIDLIAINDLEKRLVIAEIKLNHDKISLATLKLKASQLVENYPGYQIDYLGLSLKDVEHYLRLVER